MVLTGGRNERLSRNQAVALRDQSPRRRERAAQGSHPTNRRSGRHAFDLRRQREGDNGRHAHRRGAQGDRVFRSVSVDDGEAARLSASRPIGTDEVRTLDKPVFNDIIAP